ncbi:zinc finger C3HC4 type domain containing protein [Nitzschia inconspicua]|uniref:Zinc finger C3HC4 type domain containing protein n=1 Tax=Nitzschia inconspicua TaxID=303405 RepID=A0A9K3KIK0_9STRA|nr:zinc finger C3HC4 type domain containing protein [Nitzschia inconspicua]
MGKKSRNRNKKKAVTGDGGQNISSSSIFNNSNYDYNSRTAEVALKFNSIFNSTLVTAALASHNRILPPPNGHPIKLRPKHSDAFLVHLNGFVPDQYLDMIFARGSNGPFSTKNSLREYLLKLVSDSKFHSITVPLVFGLAMGPPHIHKEVLLYDILQEPASLLYWACRWKHLRLVGYWPAESELIDMILKAGGIEKINNPLKNGMNPLFIAVNYADLKGVDILLDAGIKVDHRNANGETALKNAVEHPQPPIVARLLEYLPVTEKIKQGDDRQTGAASEPNLVELIIHQLQLVSMVPTWVVLGPPSSENIIGTIHLLQNKGCHFSDFSKVGLGMLQFLFKKDYILNSPALFLDVGRALVGEKLPDYLQPTIERLEWSFDGSIEESSCPICRDPLRKEVTLYCGHTFCVDCIIDCANISSNCPLCHSMLCPDLSFHPGRTMTFSLSNILGLSHGMERFSVSKLTDEQIRMEAKFQGIDTHSVPTAKLRSMLEEDERSRCTTQTITDKINNRRLEIEFIADLSAQINMVRGNTMHFAPESGRVCIEVYIQGVPVFAYVANRNLYTVVSKAFADQFHLKQNDMLQSKTLRSTATGRRVKNSSYTCLEPFVVNVRGINVTLRNAIVQDPCLVPMCGIHLGMDFFASAAYCPMDVKIKPEGGKDIFVRVEKQDCWLLNGSSQETLRFYSRDGRSAHLPLLHFSPFEDDIFLGIGPGMDTKYDACFWCCRLFPEGMMVCANCDNAGRKITYCDARCQKAAWRVHRRRIETMPRHKTG